MPKLVDFADGFTSASAPDLDAAGSEVYELLNNQSLVDNFQDLVFDGFSSVFALVEIERANSSSHFRQSMEIIFAYDNTTGWTMNAGNYVGSDLLQSAITNVEHVVIGIDSVTGQVNYTSGNMDATDYVGKLKLVLTKVTL